MSKTQATTEKPKPKVTWDQAAAIARFADLEANIENNSPEWQSLSDRHQKSIMWALEGLKDEEAPDADQKIDYHGLRHALNRAKRGHWMIQRMTSSDPNKAAHATWELNQAKKFLASGGQNHEDFGPIRKTQNGPTSLTFNDLLEYIASKLLANFDKNIDYAALNDSEAETEEATQAE